MLKEIQLDGWLAGMVMPHLKTMMNGDKQTDFNVVSSIGNMEPKASVSMMKPDVQKGAHNEAVKKKVPDEHPQRKAIFRCMVCNKHFANRSSLFNHKKRFGHPPSRNYRCPYCTVTVKTMKHLALHKVIHTPGLTNCPVCGLKIPSVESGHIHMQTHYGRGNKSCRCALCGKLFDTEYMMRRHQIAHSSIRKFKCKICGACFKTHRNLSRHVPTHSGKWKFTCSTCGYGDNYKCRLERHKNGHKRLMQLSCEFCGVQARSRALLMAHVRKHLRQKGHDRYTLKCSLCQILFPTEIDLSIHIYRQHSEKCNVCEVCLEMFPTLDCLITHAKDQHSISEKACNLCNESVLDIYQCNKKHVVEKHLGYFKCFTCSRVFSRVGGYHKHFKFNHPDHTMHCCKLCGENFETIDSLQKHASFCEKVVCYTRQSRFKGVRARAPAENMHDESRTNQEMTPEIQCISCSTKFPNLHDLQTHLLSGCPATVASCTQETMTPETNITSDQEQNSHGADNTSEPVKTQNSDCCSTSEVSDAKPAKKKRIIPTATCTICNQTFRNKLRLSRHMWRTHTEQWKDSENALQLNTNTNNQGPQVHNHHNSADESMSEEKINDKSKNQKNFKCFACGKEYWKSLALEMHIERRHCVKSPEENKSRPENILSDPEKTAKELLFYQREERRKKELEVEHRLLQGLLPQSVIEAIDQCKTVKDQLADMRKEGLLPACKESDELDQCKTVKDQLAYMRKERLLPKSVVEASPVVNAEENPEPGRNPSEQHSLLQMPLLPKPVVEASPILRPTININQPFQVVVTPGVQQNLVGVLVGNLSQIVPGTPPILSQTVINELSNRPGQVVVQPGVETRLHKTLLTSIEDTNVRQKHIAPNRKHISLPVQTNGAPNSLHTMDRTAESDNLVSAASEAGNCSPLDLSIKSVRSVPDKAEASLKITDVHSFIDLTEHEHKNFPSHEAKEISSNGNLLNTSRALSNAFVTGLQQPDRHPKITEGRTTLSNGNSAVAQKSLPNALSLNQPQSDSNVTGGSAGNGRLVVDCFICDKIFLRINDLLDHLRNQHN